MHKFNVKKVKYDVDQIIGYFGIEVVHNDDYSQNKSYFQLFVYNLKV